MTSLCDVTARVIGSCGLQKLAYNTFQTIIFRMRSTRTQWVTTLPWSKNFKSSIYLIFGYFVKKFHTRFIKQTASKNIEICRFYGWSKIGTIVVINFCSKFSGKSMLLNSLPFYTLLVTLCALGAVFDCGFSRKIGFELLQNVFFSAARQKISYFWGINE